MIVEDIATIEARLIAMLQANPDLYDPNNPDPTKRGLTSPSNVSKWRNFLHIVSVEIKTMQDQMSIFEEEIEGLIELAAPAIPLQVQKKVFEFQYDAATPQVAILDTTNFTVGYPVIDTALRIISRCSVKTDANKTVQIKVATGNPPGPLNNAQQLALSSYADMFLPAGVKKKITSQDADKLWISAEIFYNGQYATTIQASVIAAIEAFLATIPFNGIVEISEIEDAIQAVAGVEDVVINQVKARDHGTLFPAAATVVKEWQTIAGYIVQETETNQTFADTLTFTVEI